MPRLPLHHIIFAHLSGIAMWHSHTTLRATTPPCYRHHTTAYLTAPHCAHCHTTHRTAAHMATVCLRYRISVYPPTFSHFCRLGRRVTVVYLFCRLHQQRRGWAVACHPPATTTACLPLPLPACYGHLPALPPATTTFYLVAPPTCHACLPSGFCQHTMCPCRVYAPPDCTPRAPLRIRPRSFHTTRFCTARRCTPYIT